LEIESWRLHVALAPIILLPLSKIPPKKSRIHAAEAWMHALARESEVEMLGKCFVQYSDFEEIWVAKPIQLLTVVGCIVATIFWRFLGFFRISAMLAELLTHQRKFQSKLNWTPK